MKFRKKPIVIEATQWFKNGDHPDDDQYLVEPSPDSTTQFAPFMSEGKVVRYFSSPYVPGDSPCPQCGAWHRVHGWIDTPADGHRVCPGDWIITGVKGEHYPCKPDVFAATYEAAESEPHDPREARLRIALDIAVGLQSHYAELLNHFDGGKRMTFATGEDWLKRLAHLGKLGSAGEKGEPK